MIGTRQVQVLLAVLALAALASCGRPSEGDEKERLAEAMTLGAEVLSVDPPSLSETECSGEGGKNRTRFEASTSVPVPEEDLDRLMAEIETRWDGAGLDADLRTRSAGTGPAVRIRRGKLLVSATSAVVARDGMVLVSLGGSTGCRR